MMANNGAFLYQIGQRFFAVHNNEGLVGGQLATCPDLIGAGTWISEEQIQNAFYTLLQIVVDRDCGALAPSGNVATLISNTSAPVPPEIAQCAKEGVEHELAQVCYLYGGIIGASVVIFLFTIAYIGIIAHRDARLMNLRAVPEEQPQP